MDETQAAKLTAELERIVLARVSSGNLVLPALPVVAQRCREVLKDPDFNHKRLLQHMETEPMLVAIVMRSANVAAYGSPTKNLDQAILRLGAEKLKSLVIEYGSRELFQSSDKRIADASKRIWEHSVAVALLARDIAAFSGCADGDVCYIGGLLHDVGKPVLAAMLLELERQIGNGRAGWLDLSCWVKAVELTHRKIGVAVATEWKLPDEVISAVRDCSDYDSGDRNGAANVVRLANVIAKREGYSTGPIDTDDTDAMVMVGRSMLGVDNELIARLASGLKQRVGSVVA